jgi:small GTP-binding protein
LLDHDRRALLDETRRLLRDVESQLAELDLPAATRLALAAAAAQLAEPFLLVVVGEFNAGKSAFINALVGRRVLEEGVTPTTSKVAVLRFAAEAGVRSRADGLIEVNAPAELLRSFAVVDTPGTNAVLREHEALTREFLPRADLVLFVTSADRPYTESERAFLEAIREWGKKVVVVVNKADLLRSGQDQARVVEFVREHASRTLGGVPDVFALSALAAIEAREKGDEAALAKSGLPAFEAAVLARLGEADRFRLKLKNPAGLARRALREAAERVALRRATLADDRAALAAIESRVAQGAGRLRSDFALRVSDVEKVLLEFEKRGHAFFDERLRLGRFRELFDRDRLRREFEAEAVGRLPMDVERRVGGVVDFLVEAELAQWQDVMAILAERPATRPGALGRVDDRFALDRARILDAVGKAAGEAVSHYDAPAEARRLAEKVRESVAQTALLQVSALGLGTIVAALASTTAADVTGIVAAGVLSLIGFVLLPARRDKARRELAAKVGEVRGKLMGALSASFEAEAAGANERIRAAVAPYAAFVGREQQRVAEAQRALESLSARLDGLEGRVDAIR